MIWTKIEKENLFRIKMVVLGIEQISARYLIKSLSYFLQHRLWDAL